MSCIVYDNLNDYYLIFICTSVHRCDSEMDSAYKNLALLNYIKSKDVRLNTKGHSL